MSLQPRCMAQVNLSALRSNLRLLARGSRGAVAMVKANAYGHGLVEVGKALATLKETAALGVAALSEGIALREAGIRARIWVFSDCTPWREDLAQLCKRYRLTPVLHSLSDVQAILEDRVGFHVKFNTGMNRLGIAPSEASKLRSMFIRSRVYPEGICTHFAMAEEPSHAVTRAQVKLFKQIVNEFSGIGDAHIHCANTAAILESRKLGLEGFCDLVRPGIGLYGYGGSKGERLGLKTALLWRARVIAARSLEPGMRVGYGATFKAARRTPQAVIAIGYGDGFRRSLSGKKIGNTLILGRVSMDLTSLCLKAKPGSWVTLMGEGERQGEALARSAGTIVYEILTGITSRVPRIYG